MKFSLYIRILLFVFAPHIIGTVNLIAASKVVNSNGKRVQNNGFIENKGQIIDQKNNPNPAVLYLLNTPGMNVQLRKGGFSYDLYKVGSR